MKNRFEDGIRVFDTRFGWGTARPDATSSYYNIKVTFDGGKIKYYTCGEFYNDEDLFPILSYTEYTHQESSQERPKSDKFRRVLNDLCELSEEEILEMVKLITNK